jgi:hypothetical protein
VKKVARLMLFFSLCFAVLFVLAALGRYLAIRIDVLRLLPAREETPLPELVTAARWAPRGTLMFSFADNVFTAGELKGDLTIVERSIDHLIFEMENTVKPDYEITYSCEKTR